MYEKSMRHCKFNPKTTHHFAQFPLYWALSFVIPNQPSGTTALSLALPQTVSCHYFSSLLLAHSLANVFLLLSMFFIQAKIQSQVEKWWRRFADLRYFGCENSSSEFWKLRSPSLVHSGVSASRFALVFFVTVNRIRLYFPGASRKYQIFW